MYQTILSLFSKISLYFLSLGRSGSVEQQEQETSHQQPGEGEPDLKRPASLSTRSSTTSEIRKARCLSEILNEVQPPPVSQEDILDWGQEELRGDPVFSATASSNKLTLEEPLRSRQEAARPARSLECFTNGALTSLFAAPCCNKIA